jgi:hypothetical protein
MIGGVSQRAYTRQRRRSKSVVVHAEDQQLLIRRNATKVSDAGELD